MAGRDEKNLRRRLEKRKKQAAAKRMRTSPVQAVPRIDRREPVGKVVVVAASSDE